MINYFNFSKRDNGYLLTNDFGMYAFVSDNTFDELIHDNVSKDNPERDILIEKDRES